MRKSLTLLVPVLAAFIFSGCLKEGSQSFTCTATMPQITVPANEIAAVEAYLAQKGITDAQKSNFGFYYKIDVPGSGATPTVCSNVTLYYQGKLIDGTTFDQTGSSAVTFQLGQLISGWQLGLPLIKPGGKIKLYLPPTLGYGSRTVGSIPANSILIFEISLVAI
jgi:FKBP-type peptidyl-prolyl cis-trans isomerase FkpA